jgi:DNA polymerase III epsilon subunit-like protein
MEVKKNDPTKNYRYLVVDIETKGQHQTKNDMLCFAACIGNSLTGEIEDEFIVYLKHRGAPSENWEKLCLDEFWDQPSNKQVKATMLKKIEDEGVEPNLAMRAFWEWINRRPQGDIDSLIVVTDTAGFDIGFLNHYLSEADVPSMNYIVGNVYKPTRDSSSFHMGVGRQLPSTGLWGSDKAACKALNIDPEVFKSENPFSHDHNPLNDAKSICWEILQIDRKIRERG